MRNDQTEKSGYDFDPSKAYDSTKARIERVVEIVKREYEAGDQRKMYKAIWRRFIYPEFGICYKTMLQYLKKKPSEYSRSKKGDQKRPDPDPDRQPNPEKPEL